MSIGFGISHVPPIFNTFQSDDGTKCLRYTVPGEFQEFPVIVCAVPV